MGIKAALLVSLSGLIVVGCSQGHCRRRAEAPLAVAGPQEVATGKSAASTVAASDRVFVYKYDGSLQCGKGKALSLDAMAQELQGVPIISSVKKTDGLMHIQACGSITGMANVYEISTKNLKKAESKGFKKWSFE